MSTIHLARHICLFSFFLLIVVVSLYSSVCSTSSTLSLCVSLSVCLCLCLSVSLVALCVCLSLSGSVGPFARGDTPLQYYNELFATQYLQEYADATLYTDNDELCRSVVQADERSRGDESRSVKTGAPGAPPSSNVRVDFARLNRALAHDLASALFPLRLQSEASAAAAPFTQPPFDHRPPPPERASLWTAATFASPDEVRPWRSVHVGQIVAAAVPTRSLRFLEVRSSFAFDDALGPAAVRRRKRQGSSGAGGVSGGGASLDWAGLTKATQRLAPTRDRDARAISTLAVHLTLRGIGSNEANTRGSGGGGGGRAKRSGDWRGDREPVLDAHAHVFHGAAGAAALKEAGSALRKSLGGAGLVSGAPAGDGTTRRRQRPGSGSGDYGAGRDAEADALCYSSGDCGHGRLAFRGPHVARSVAVVANRTHVAARFRHVLAAAAKKFIARAYVHWYAEHGLEDEDFAAAFAGVREIVESYDAHVKSNAAACVGTGAGSAPKGRGER